MTRPSPPVHSPPKTLEQAPTELLLTISRPLPARQSDPRVLTSYPYTPLYLLQAAWYNPTRKTAQREGIIVLLGASSSTKMNAYVKVYKENSGPFVADRVCNVQVKERSSNPRWVRSSNPKWGQCSRRVVVVWLPTQQRDMGASGQSCNGELVGGRSPGWWEMSAVLSMR